MLPVFQWISGSTRMTCREDTTSPKEDHSMGIPTTPFPMRSLEKLLARNLPCTRGEARRLLTSGECELPPKASPAALPTRVTVLGRTIDLHDSFHLMMHKPAGCVTALSDGRHPAAV